MILFELFGSEGHPFYQELHISNGNRYFDFLRSIVEIAVKTNKVFLSQIAIRAFNYHAICCLHTHAGDYRPCQVFVGQHVPPEHYRVQALMDDFVNEVNVNFKDADPVLLATFVLWRLKFIYPFINGNGRTAELLVTLYSALSLVVGLEAVSRCQSFLSGSALATSWPCSTHMKLFGKVPTI